MVYFTKISSPANENIIGLLVRGHANYAKKTKRILICSAVSAIAQTALYGCNEYSKCNVNKIQKGYDIFYL